jgi:hypothetical protein
MSDGMPRVEEEEYCCLGTVGGTEVSVQPTRDGQDIWIKHGSLGQRLACLLAIGQTDIVRREGVYYWRINHNRQVDELMVELIDLLISIRYAHPAMVQLEMVLEPDGP